MRSMLVAQKGKTLVQFDLSQAETWVVAYYADSETMKHSLHHGDIHTDTAAAIFRIDNDFVTKIQRFLGKKANHELSYGASYHMLVQSINAESDMPPYITVSNREGKDLFDGWHRVHWAVEQNYWSFVQNKLGQDRVLITPYERYRIFYDAWGIELFKKAYAFLPQSTVADHTNGAVQPELGIEGGILTIKRKFVDSNVFSIVNQSHDSFITEVPNDRVGDIIEPVTQLLQRPLVINGEEFTIPVDVECGERWGELEKVKI